MEISYRVLKLMAKRLTTQHFMIIFSCSTCLPSKGYAGDIESRSVSCRYDPSSTYPLPKKPQNGFFNCVHFASPLGVSVQVYCYVAAGIWPRYCFDQLTPQGFSSISWYEFFHNKNCNRWHGNFVHIMLQQIKNTWLFSLFLFLLKRYHTWTWQYRPHL